jgi:RNA polymerase sigma factor (sigma-70 family)
MKLLMDSTSDEILVRECIAGNRQYQEMLYKKFCWKMMGVCMRYSKNKEEAEDFLQEGFIKVFTNLRSFKAKGSFEGWIRRIIVNTILDGMRKKSLMFKVVDIEEAGSELGAEDLLSEVSVQDLVNMIQELAPGYRTVFNLFAVEGYTHKEIGARLGISEGTSKSQFAMARKILREKIDEQEKEISLRKI